MAEKSDWIARSRLLLLGHIFKQARLGVHYVALEDRVGGPKKINFPSDLAVQLSKILLCHAHAWALDMHDWQNPSAAEQRESWAKAMECADKECEEARDGKTASANNALKELL